MLVTGKTVTMLSMNTKYQTIDEYIKMFPENVRLLLEKVRKTIKKAAPKATEGISYGIPTFKLNGNLVHFAAYEHHIGFYPCAIGIKSFAKELQGYKTSKGTVQFSLDKPIPFDLITRITKLRVEQNEGK